MRPASTNVLAKTTTAIVYTHDVWLRVHPNSFSSGSTKTLHAYNEPSARFIDTPPTTTRQRFMKRPPVGAYDIAPDLKGDAMKTFDAGTAARWRKWLAAHHASESEIWLIFHKRHTGRPSVAYLHAVDEALCFGWIDSLIKR